MWTYSNQLNSWNWCVCVCVCARTCVWVRRKENMKPLQVETLIQCADMTNRLCARQKKLLQTQKLDNSSLLANILFYLTHDTWNCSDLCHFSKGAAGNPNWTISVSIPLFCRQCKSKEIMQNTTSSSTLQHIYRHIASVAVMSQATFFWSLWKKSEQIWLHPNVLKSKAMKYTCCVYIAIITIRCLRCSIFTGV